MLVGFGGLGVACSPRDPRFAGSNPAGVVGFFPDVTILSTSPPGGTLSWGSRVWDFKLVKEARAWKIDLWAKFNRHIHVLVIPKFGGAQYILKRSQCIGQQWPPHQSKYKYNCSVYFNFETVRCLSPLLFNCAYKLTIVNNLKLY